MRHVPNLKALTSEELTDILGRAAAVKKNPESYHQALKGKSMAMLFQKTSTRTRVSFEVGMFELGGHAVFIDWMTSNFVLSGIENETEYLSRNVSCIMARLMHHEDLNKIISASKVPVINGCCEKFHPCQALTDVLTMAEHFEGGIDAISKAHLAYVGVQNNVSNSLVLICDKLDIRLTLATPAINDNGESTDADVQQIIASSTRINHVVDPGKLNDVDFIYTDTWIDMQYFNNPDFEEEKEARIKEMLPYQINAELIAGMSGHIMHDMPIHEGYEITADAVRDPRAIIFEQAENRLHAQKGLLLWLFEQA
ncbi:MAG: ornithine carbamoyltransferase [Candidatus Azotimanducaceae bacterium]